jgi:uncharacterized protein
MRILWLIAGVMSLALGLIGVALPLLPTVPFLILAAFCFARSSERLHDWLISHRTLGPPIQDWRRSGAIGRKGKIAGSVSIAAAFAISLALGVAPLFLGIQAVTLVAVSVFIWTRPEA